MLNRLAGNVSLCEKDFLEPSDYHWLYNFSIAEALGRQINIGDEYTRGLKITLTGNLETYDEKEMFELYGELLEIIFPGENGFKKACLETGGVFTRALRELKKEQNKLCTREKK